MPQRVQLMFQSFFRHPITASNQTPASTIAVENQASGRHTAPKSIPTFHKLQTRLPKVASRSPGRSFAGVSSMRKIPTLRCCARHGSVSAPWRIAACAHDADSVKSTHKSVSSVRQRHQMIDIVAACACEARTPQT